MRSFYAVITLIVAGVLSSRAASLSNAVYGTPQQNADARQLRAAGPPVVGVTDE